MSAIEFSARTELGVPVSNELFKARPDSVFWIGKVASDNSVDNSEYYDATARLRASIYVDEMKFLGPEHVDPFGRELDEYDERSIHLAVIENSNPTENEARVIGSSRLIVKNELDEPLPVEGVFPEVFEEAPIDVPAVEVSRFISRHEDDATQHTIAIALIRTMTYQVQQRNIDTAYFVVERPLLRLLKALGMPLEVAGKPKEVTEPGGIRTLYPIKITPSLIAESVTKDGHGHIILKEFFKNEAENRGEGYYPKSLTGGTNE